MTYYKNRYGTYTVQVEAGTDLLTGKRVRKTGSAKTVREAKRIERELELGYWDGKTVPTSLTLSEFIESQFWRVKSHLRGNTIRNYRSTLNRRVIPVLGNHKLQDITTTQVQILINSCPTYKEAKSAREVLRVVLSVAYDMKIVQDNAARSRMLVYPRRPDQRMHQNGVWLSNMAEHKAILELAKDTAPRNVYLILLLGLGFGLRKGEILGLNWGDIDFKSRELYVKRTYIC